MALQTKLKACGIEMKVVSALPGASLSQQVFQGIVDANVIVIMASKTYGHETSGVIDTRKEVEYIYALKKSVFIVKMCDKLLDPVAAGLLNFASTSYVEWIPGTEMPANLMTKLMDKLSESRQTVKLELSQAMQLAQAEAVACANYFGDLGARHRWHQALQLVQAAADVQSVSTDAPSTQNISTQTQAVAATQDASTDASLPSTQEVSMQTQPVTAVQEVRPGAPLPSIKVFCFFCDYSVYFFYYF